MNSPNRVSNPSQEPICYECIFEDDAYCTIRSTYIHSPGKARHCKTFHHYKKLGELKK